MRPLASIADDDPITLAAATWLMQAGVEVWQAAGFLGMTAEMLERVYGHHSPIYQKQAADAVSKRRA